MTGPDGVMRDNFNLMIILIIFVLLIIKNIIMMVFLGDCTLQDDLDARVEADQRAHPHSLRRAIPHLSEDFKQGQ